jgi:hypothetical protein
MSPQEIVIQANEIAIATLKKTGCTYKITDRFGNVHTSKTCTTRPKVYDWFDLKISERVRAAAPGDQIVFEAKGRPLKALSSVASGKANKVLGNGKHRVTQNAANQTVTITVLGKREAAGLDEALAALGNLQ